MAYNPALFHQKCLYITDRLRQSNQLFMAITETWLKDHKDTELKISGYELFRADRERKKNSRRGRLSGGPAAYVKDDIAS